jgi:hypothetical protein
MTADDYARTKRPATYLEHAHHSWRAPRCFACRGRMEQFAGDNNARVQYTCGPGEHGAGSFTIGLRARTPAADPGTDIVGMPPGTTSHWRPTASWRAEN